MACNSRRCILCLLLVLIKRAESRHRIGRQANEDIDLAGVRIDTAHAITDYDSNGLVIIKPNTNVTVRLFGTKLHELKTLLVTSSDSCSLKDNVQQSINFDSMVELSPNTATFVLKLPHHSTTYCFCFEWRQQSELGNNTNGRFVFQGSQAYCCIGTAKKSWLG